VQALELDLPFEGYALNAVDAKGRVSVPSDFRDLIANRCRTFAPGDASISETSLSMSLADEEDRPRLMVYDAVGVRRLASELRAGLVDLPAAERRKALAEVGGDEMARAKANFDSVGRLVLPEMLRDFAEIEGLALFWGNIEFFEIWNPLKALEAWADKPNRLRTVRYLLKQKGIAA
jgi:MraZ protein